jgi:hypothetical protein
MLERFIEKKHTIDRLRSSPFSIATVSRTPEARGSSSTPAAART